jgi:hypothetical protein
MNTKITLTTIFAGSIVLANVLAAKLTWVDLPIIGGVAVPAGFVAMGVAYLASDLLVEYHGKDTARSVVNATILTLSISYGLIWVSIAMPTAPFWGLQSAFVSILGGSASIVVASIIALAVAQHIDVSLFASLMNRTDGNHKWIRNCGSTITSQAVDTTLFVGLGFGLLPLLGFGGTAQTGVQLLSIIVGQYVVKVIVAVIDTVPFYILSRKARKS